MPRPKVARCCSASRTPTGRGHEGAILAILDGLRWLELDWDGEPVYQFARAARHREAAEQLLAEGKAYRCYASAEELAAMRELARTQGRAPGYDGTWRDRDESMRRPASRPSSASGRRARARR